MKFKTRYVCDHCGAESPKWLGKCLECGAWNSFQEQLISPQKHRLDSDQIYAQGEAVELLRLQEIAYHEADRLKTGLQELDRAVGGGLVPGSLVLLGGEPGIGKSTLLLQSAFCMAEQQGHPVIYISGEESAQQLKARAQRLGFEQSQNLFILAETEMQTILSVLAQRQPVLAILDSIQAVYDSRLESPPGGVSQVKNTCNLLLKLAKQKQITIWIIGHVNKDGDIAGPKVLEHMVDTVLYFEGERYRSFRLLRTIKNRFGATHEVGVFEMTGLGLQGVDNPSALFLSEYTAGTSGSVVGVTLEGTRPLLVEIQALSYASCANFPKRSANGIHLQRLIQILAVLEKRVGLNLSKFDVLVNVVGGLSIEEPAADLAVALALVSGVRDIPLDGQTVCLGEVGLAGEIRSVSQLERRLLEAAKLGFMRALVPAANLPLQEVVEGLEIVGVCKLTEALRVLHPEKKSS